MPLAIEDIAHTATPLLQRRGVKFAGIFGSYARGEAREESDIDLLVRLRDNAGLLDLVGLELDLAEALGRRVDVVTESALHPLLRDRILRDVRVLYDGAR